jgi:hypothetical protein
MALALIAGNVSGLADLMVESNSTVVATLMLMGGLALTCGSLAMGTAVMLLPRSDAGADEAEE